GAAADTRPTPDDGPFFGSLMEMKRLEDARRDRPSEEAAQRVWARVDDATRSTRIRPDRSAVRRSDRRTPRWVWLSAAAAVLAFAVVTMLTLRTPEPVLVARAGAASIEFTTEDGSLVTLRAHSDLYRLDAPDAGARYRLEGEAFFDVTERSTGTFAVEAGTAVVEVLGTRFNLSTWSGETSVYLEEGRIRFVHAASGREVVLQPGQSSRTITDGVLDPMDDVPDMHVDWLAGAIEFDQQPVRVVAAELEQHYDIAIEIPDTMADETLSGRVLLGSVEESLEDLGLALGGRFIPAGPDVYRFESQ
ncbi:MAG: FecR domain-containing protein, partial [Rhodothermales bacterium]